MKFTVTSLVDVASSLTPGTFETIVSGCPAVQVDIRNPSATVANLKAAASVKLKCKDAPSLRLLTVVSIPTQLARDCVTDESNTDLRREARILDDVEADRRVVLSTLFKEGPDTIYQLYCLRSSEISSDILGAVAAGGQTTIVEVNNNNNNNNAANIPLAPSLTADLAAVKRNREEPSNGGDRTILSPVAAQPAIQPPPLPAMTATAEAVTEVPRQENSHIVDEGRDADWVDDDEDDDVEEWAEAEEGDDWGSDDEDGIEWINHALDLGLVPELSDEERSLISALVELPNAANLIQQVMDGNTAAAMADVQVTSPHLFTLISQHGELFTELMADIKDMLDGGVIANKDGVIDYLRQMLAPTAGDDGDSFDEDDDSDMSGEGDGVVGEEGGEGATGPAETRHERRRNRRVANEAAMTDAMNAIAGGASEVRPLTDIDEAKIVSLIELGFDREKAVAAYLRMGRNVERAANYLFEHM